MYVVFRIHLPLGSTTSSLLELNELWKTLAIDSKWKIDELEDEDKALFEGIEHSIVDVVPPAAL
jgi:hypothetical protein